MSDEPQFVVFLPEMIQQQRKPDDQGRRANNHSQGHQGQVLLTGKQQRVCKTPNRDHKGK